MLIVISPAKRLDWAERPQPEIHPVTDPDFPREAASLARTMRNLGLGELRGLMDLSDDLARLNRDRFRAYADQPDAGVTRPAVFAFAGDTYQGLDAGTLTADEIAQAQERLRILSGLYGVLRPMDGIQPYRLEMGSRLKTRRGANLSEFWRDGPARALKQQAQAIGTDYLLNCASQEYFGAVDRKRLRLTVVTPVFLEDDGIKPKVISFFAKRARGAMARFAITRGARVPGDLAAFDSDGYRFDPERSTPDAPVFIRPRQVS